MSLEGTQLGQYRLLRLIGSGGMGEVYLAEDARINQQVAIKISRTETSPYPNASSASESARLFQREARAIAQLDHPHILPLFTYGEEQIRGETLTYIVMPYRQEGSLVAWLRQHSNSILLNPQDVAAIVTQAAAALQYAHDHNVIHQDVKPANFLVRTRNDAVSTMPDLLLTDFGIAKLSSATSHSSHAVRGTATYMAPEQWIGDPVPATDQYALATMAYELLTGRPPFQGRQEQLMYAHVNTPPQPPSAFNPRLSGDTDRVLLHALAKKPEERFRSIAAFANAFQQAVQSGDAPTVIKPLSSNSPLETLAAPTIMTNSKATSEKPEKTVAVSSYIPPSSNYRREGRPTKQQTRPNGKWFIFVGLALLIILVSLGAYYMQTNYSPTTTQTTGNNKTTATVITSPNRTATAFADMRLRRSSTATAEATVTVKAGYNIPYPPYTGTLALNDPLNDNNLGYNWDVLPTQYGKCTFTGNGYDVSPQVGYYHRCMAENTDFINFAFQVDMTIIVGDCGAIIFRGNATNYQYYYFRVCQDGTYALWLFTHSGTQSKVFTQGSNTNFHSGLNEIAVVADNTAISTYINHQFVTTIQDSTYSQGQIGVAADSSTNPTEVVFSNAKVWTF